MPLKVLLADDNITAQRMGCKILSDAGYTVVAVSNGAAAVKKIASERPDVIILDVYMPGYTGLEVCEKVKNSPETMRVPVLLTVTNMEPFRPEEGSRAKADGVLIKPFEPTDLLAVLRKFEERIHTPAPPAAADTTTRLEVYEEPGHIDSATGRESAPPKPEMSVEVASAPALGIEDLEFGPDETASVPLSPFAVESPVETATLDANLSGVFDLETFQPAAAPEIVPPAELEPTSAPQAAELEVALAPELEVTAQESTADVASVQDPALATDPTDFDQFVTKFGQENPEDVPVGIATEEMPLPELEIEASSAEVPDIEIQADAVAEEPAPEPEIKAEESTSAVSIEQEPALETEPAKTAPSDIDQFVANLGEPQPEQDSVSVVTEEVPPALEFKTQDSASEVPQDSAPSTESSEYHRFVEELREENPVAVGEAESPYEDGTAEIHELVPESVPMVHATSYEQDLRQAFEIPVSTAAAVAPAPEPETVADTQPLDIVGEVEPMPPEIEPVLEPEHPANLTERLVAQFAAELEAAQQKAQPSASEEAAAAVESSSTETPSAPAMNEQHVADAVTRVLDRYKSELIAAIVRELKS